MWLKPAGTTLFASTGAPLSLSLSKNGVNVKYINTLIAKKPTLLVMNFNSPRLIDEIYSDKSKGNIKSVLATFGTTSDALLDIISGKFKPTGKMPLTIPVSEEAVKNQKEDVPGYLEGEGYALFKYDEGLRY